MAFILRAIALISFLLFARPVQAQDTFTTTIEIVSDTEDQHFEDYWRRANEALLTPDGRQRLDRGQTRLSLRSMSNPTRYGLVLPTHADQVVTAADLLCDNRENNSLQLRCRMPGAPHARRVRLTDAACAGKPDLFTLIPDGCERVYVMTVEGRDVTTSRLVPVPPIPRDVSPPPTQVAVANLPVAEPSPTPSQELVSLRREVRDLRDERRDLRTELRNAEHGLNHAYLGILLLVLIVMTATGILWKQRGKIDEQEGMHNTLTEHVHALSEASARATLNGLKRENELRLQLKEYTRGLRAEAVTYFGALFQRNLALERELKLAQERPSIVIDESVFRLEEFEKHAAESERRLREAQDLERKTLQDRIAELMGANARLTHERDLMSQTNRRLEESNIALRLLMDRGHAHSEGLGLDVAMNPLTAPPPPSTRSINRSPSAERHTLTGIGSEPPPPAGTSMPPPKHQGSGRLTPSLVEALCANVEGALSESWDPRPTPSDIHPPLDSSGPEATGFWQVQEDGSVHPLTPQSNPSNTTNQSPTDVDVFRAKTREVDTGEQTGILRDASLTPSS